MSENLKLVEYTKPIAPPVNSIGALEWLKKNLFNNWFNSVLTIVSAIVLYLVVTNALYWVFIEAQWAVISNNYKLFMVGQYPVSELWRVWVALLFASLLFGMSSGVWKGTMIRIASILTLIYLLHIIVPFTATESKVWLSAQIGVLIFGYFLGSFLPKAKWITLIGWFFVIPVSILLLRGFGIGAFPLVRTNLWNGLLLTILISIVAIVLSMPIGVLLALGRTSKLPAIKYFCISYIELIRGIPLITILFMAQIIVPLFLPPGMAIDNVVRVMIGATLFTSAYMAENVRGGLQSIPKGQYEAAKTIGLNPVQTTTFIILPQALRAIIPTIVGQSISMFKDTTLVAIVGLVDLLGIAQSVKSNPDFLGRHMEVYIFIAFVYWVIAYTMSYSSRRLEKSLGVGER
ncbi:general L-amino acid transport system permease protein [Natronobacillus azotifigens]|uniref:Amino acid ABC transporter permease n=1 Tax=Natronobacillus azotifigens TaxID=472978 RepID=A0A9J6R820_9BACI|nr:amino acid ABC transporter permease [Natronobacillus azotifigens]MCZ0701773.1 amino acid ABC transporter permease [Natronobacillus azotifigens]